MTWYNIEKHVVNAEESDFFRAVNIWLEKPHVVNRRLCDSNLLWERKVHVDENSDVISEFINTTSCQYLNRGDNLKEIIDNLNAVKSEDILLNCTEILIQLRKLSPKQAEKYSPSLVLILINKLKSYFVTIPLENCSYLTPKFAYKLSFHSGDNNDLCLCVYDNHLSQEEVQQNPGVCWLKNTLFPRIKKWSENKSTESFIQSLRLVAVDKYNSLYINLKNKYGLGLVKKWPEKTDPQKFVYEDVAIATYLILLWEEERRVKNLTTKQSFVDLGCGNGLLVYLLTKEGYSGYGLDVRKRKIWDLYPEVKLLESPIIPSAQTTYPDCDWLIGNHSDELTPWIPVMAARSSYNSRFFLLPCCAHDFDCKFQRSAPSQSQYQAYLDYIKQVATVCGFNVEIDKLRIPSTKRICLIGMSRNYEQSEENLVDEKRKGFIEQRCKCNSSVQSEDKEAWAKNFSARNSVEPVVNCTQLDKNLIEDMIKIISTSLLNDEKNISTTDENGHVKYWNTGGKLSLANLAEIVGKEKLSRLKCQCGGLQTLLRNHNNIFKVTDGSVMLRNYTESFSNQRRTKKPATTKIFRPYKPCWFHFNHPNGCILISKNCRFLHSTQ